MVDLVDIGFSVDSSQIKTAKQELAELGNSFNSATKSASIFEQAFARASAQSAKDAKFLRDTVRANQELINTNLGVSNSYKSAKDSASAFGVVLSNIDRASKSFTSNFNNLVGVTKSSATSGGAGFGAIENEVERLRLKYNQIYASSQLYERSLVELSQAHMLGVVSTKQHEAAVESLNMEYQNFQSGIAQAGNRFAQYSAQSASGMNKFGVATQQLGYQVGDFLVQVQSGTNWMVAFGQQATQLVGVLPSLAGTLGMSVSSLIAISTGLGIAIPLVTAIGAYFMRTGDSAKKSAESVDAYSEALKGLQNSIKDTQLALDKLSFGTKDPVIAAAKKAQAEAEAQLQLARANQRKIGNTLAPTAEQSAALKEAVTNWTNISGILRELEAKQAALAEAQRMLNGGLSIAGGLQRAAVLAKQEQLRLAKEQAVAEQDAANKANYLKQVFHMLAGETSSISVGLKELPPILDKAAIAAYKLAAAMADTRTAASAVLSSMVQMDAARLRKQGQVQAAAAGFVGRPELDIVGNRAAVNAARSAILEENNAPETGGGGGGIDKVQALLDSLQTQKEVVDAWYEESQVTLQSASDKELAIIGGRHEAELRLETEHQQRMAGIKEAVKQNNLSVVLGSGAQVLAALGAHNEKAAKMAKIFGAAQALADTYVGAAAALKLPFPANLAAAASIISAGLGFVAAIRSGGTASAKGGSISGGSPASVGTTATAAPATPLSVMIQGIKPTDIFTGEQLSTLFDSLYKENRNRGMVFQVAR